MNGERNTVLDWERSVIATAVTTAASMEEAADLLPSDFTGANQIVWAEVLALHNREGLDLRALLNALRNAPDWELVSPSLSVENYMAEVMTFHGTNMPSYVEMVIDRSTKRMLRKYAALIAAEAEDNTKTAAELVDFAETKILSLRRNRTDNELTMADLIGIFIPRMEGLRAGTIQPAFTPHVAGIADIIKYMEEEDYLINASRPGEGKSSLMRYEFYHAAKRGKPVGILNYENAPIEYARYFLSMETGIDSAKLKSPRLLNREELDCIRRAAETLARLPIKVVTTPRTAPHAIRAARKMVAEDKITLLGVDYLQLLNNGVDNRANDLAMTSGMFRAFALDYHIPVWANAQLSREIERRGASGREGAENNAEPQLSDLRESGALEQDATIVMFPRPLRTLTIAQLELFPENYDDNGTLLNSRPRAVPVYFHVLKNRNGSTGVSEPVKWCKHTDTYLTLERGSIPR